MSQPEVPQEPIRSGMRARRLASIRIDRSRLIDPRPYLVRPVARYAGPLSVEPASTAMACGPCLRPISISSARMPQPSTPAGTRTRTLKLFSTLISIFTLGPAPRLAQDRRLALPRYLLKLKIERARAPTTNRDHD